MTRDEFDELVTAPQDNGRPPTARIRLNRARNLYVCQTGLVADERASLEQLRFWTCCHEEHAIKVKAAKPAKTAAKKAAKPTKKAAKK